MYGRASICCKLTAPGVPDLYQGTELRDLSLVDPDNRRPVDYDRQRPALFGVQGDYQPLAAAGPRAKHAVGFMRGGGAVTVVPRLVLGLNGDWGETALALSPGRWRNELTGEEFRGEELPLTLLLARFPVALLAREEERT